MSDSFALNPFVSIADDGTVIVTVNKSEMGQGVYTSLPMLVAEELGCELEGVRVERRRWTQSTTIPCSLSR